MGDGTKLEGPDFEFYLTQVEEFRAAEREGIERGLTFRPLDTTEAMILRPMDGTTDTTVADCVHWSMPGPIDTWNKFLFHVMKSECRVSPRVERRVPDDDDGEKSTLFPLTCTPVTHNISRAAELHVIIHPIYQ